MNLLFIFLVTVLARRLFVDKVTRGQANNYQFVHTCKHVYRRSVLWQLLENEDHII